MVKYRRVFYQYDFDPYRPGLEEFIEVFCTAVREIYSQDKYQARRVLDIYPTKFRKGKAGRDVGGNKKTTYEQEEGGKIKIEIVQVVPEDA